MPGSADKRSIAAFLLEVVVLIEIRAQMLLVFCCQLRADITAAQLDLLDQFISVMHLAVSAGKYCVAVAAQHVFVATIALVLIKYFLSCGGVAVRKWIRLCA
jgi:hypothetical protein